MKAIVKRIRSWLRENWIPMRQPGTKQYLNELEAMRLVQDLHDMKPDRLKVKVVAVPGYVQFSPRWDGPAYYEEIDGVIANGTDKERK